MKSRYSTILLLIYVEILTHNTVSSGCDYPKCQNGEEHTMCVYPEKLDTTAPKCTSSEAKAGLEGKFRSEILHVHNTLRQRVAQGKEKSQPKAANMMMLKWDSELEKIAQRFANGCEKDGQAHDKCRNLKDGTLVGQNSVNSFLKRDNMNRTESFDKMVRLWYDEVAMFSPEDVSSYQFQSQTGHYTQLVWAATNRLGCGYVEQNYQNEYFQPVMMKCNYAVAGNMMGAPVYLVGDACSKCPEGTVCSKHYPGLCVSPADDKTEVPGGSGSSSLGSSGTLICIITWKFVSVLNLWLVHTVA